MHAIVAILLCCLCAASVKRKASDNPCEFVLTRRMNGLIQDPSNLRTPQETSDITIKALSLFPDSMDCFNYLCDNVFGENERFVATESILNHYGGNYEPQIARAVAKLYVRNKETSYNDLIDAYMISADCIRIQYLLFVNDQLPAPFVAYNKLINFNEIPPRSIEADNLEPLRAHRMCNPELFTSLLFSVDKLNSFADVVPLIERLTPESSQQLLPPIRTLARRFLSPETVEMVLKLNLPLKSVADILCAIVFDTRQQNTLLKMATLEKVQASVSEVAERITQQNDWGIVEEAYTHPNEPLAILLKLFDQYYNLVTAWAVSLHQSVRFLFGDHELPSPNDLMDMYLKSTVNGEDTRRALFIQQFFREFTPGKTVYTTLPRNQTGMLDANGESIISYVCNSNSMTLLHFDPTLSAIHREAELDPDYNLVNAERSLIGQLRAKLSSASTSSGLVPPHHETELELYDQPEASEQVNTAIEAPEFKEGDSSDDIIEMWQEKKTYVTIDLTEDDEGDA